MRRPVPSLPPLVLLLAFGLAHPHPRPLPAQTTPLTRGDRVRLTVPTLAARPFVRTLDSVSVDTIRVRTTLGLLSAVPLDQVTRLESSRGVRRPTWSKTAPLWLPLVGLVGGAIGGHAKPASRSSRDDSGEFIAAVAGVLGLLTGTVIAIAVPGREVWDTVPTTTDSRKALAPALYMSPTTRGMTLGLRAEF